MDFRIQLLFLENIKYKPTACNKQDGETYNILLCEKLSMGSNID
jgi:hypothetical protein